MKNTKGTSLVSVIVAFLLLMIITTLFLQAVKLSGRMVIYAVDIRKAAAALSESYYKNPDSAVEEAEGQAVFSQGQAECFSLDMTLKSYTDPEQGGKYYFFDDSDTENAGD